MSIDVEVQHHNIEIIQNEQNVIHILLTQIVTLVCHLMFFVFSFSLSPNLSLTKDKAVCYIAKTNKQNLLKNSLIANILVRHLCPSV